MANSITCPNCGHQFEPGEMIREEVEKELRSKMMDWQKKKQAEFDQHLQEEKRKTQLEIETNLRKTITADFENKLRLLEQNSRDNEEKLKQARQKELEFLQKEQQLKNREAELELSVQKRLQEERSKLSDDLRKIEEQKTAARESEFQMKLRELEKQLEDQKKLADEMRRKAEQGSMQTQGEVQELLLEEILTEHFPFDAIQEVGKGVEGADCIQVVRTASGKECGKIIYESKRTKNWSNSWVEKLKTDMRNSQSDVAILVTQAFPKDMTKFGERDGVWICSYDEIGSVAAVLRNAIIRISEAKKSEENKGEKMQMLYNYLTGNEFRQQIEAIVEGFMSMKYAISKERIQMEKMWKEREKQLDKVLLNTSGMYGSVKGIAGASVHDIPLLEGAEDGGDDEAS